MSLKEDIQSITPSALLELFILDLTEIGMGVVLRFYSGTDANYGNIAFNGYEYVPWPITAKGFSKSAKGPFPRPEMTISNVTGYISSILPLYEDFVGAKVTRLRTLGRFLDNGSSPNPSAAAEEIFFVNQRKAEDRLTVTFELISSLDLANKTLPGRIMIANTCTSPYKGPECGWPGTNAAKWYDRNDVQVFTQLSDVCSRRLSGCKLRHGANAQLPYGGFPGMGRTGR